MHRLQSRHQPSPQQLPKPGLRQNPSLPLQNLQLRPSLKLLPKPRLPNHAPQAKRRPNKSLLLSPSNEICPATCGAFFAAIYPETLLPDYFFGNFRSRKSRINTAISSPLSSSAKWPVSSRCSSASGKSRRYGRAPSAGNISSLAPHTIKVGGR